MLFRSFSRTIFLFGVTENPSDFGGNNLIGDEREKCFLRPKKVDFAMDSFVILSSSVRWMATNQVSERKIRARCDRVNFQFPFLSQVRTAVLTKWLQMDTGVTANPVCFIWCARARVAMVTPHTCVATTWPDHQFCLGFVIGEDN